MIRKIFYCVCEYISTKLRTNFEFDLKCMARSLTSQIKNDL